jgi:Fur family iron response transcriptional regulator
MQIAGILFDEEAHFSAEEIFNEVNKTDASASKATVYNTLGLFVERGLIRKVLVDPTKCFYDSNVTSHHHFYDLDSGEIRDIRPEQISLKDMPDLPEGTCLDSVEVVVRVRKQ